MRQKLETFSFFSVMAVGVLERRDTEGKKEYRINAGLEILHTV